MVQTIPQDVVVEVVVAVEEQLVLKERKVYVEHRDYKAYKVLKDCLVLVHKVFKED
jgi:hypothetical protein